MALMEWISICITTALITVMIESCRYIEEARENQLYKRY